MLSLSVFWFSQVPADLQNEVLVSLLETDPDVVDYLLRRKGSQHSWVCVCVCVSDQIIKIENALSCLLNTPWGHILYLMCRLCFCREPDLLKASESFSLTERCLSNDSMKASTGEVSPYDNNSPVLSDGPLCEYSGDSSPFSDRIPRQHKLSGRTSPTLSADKGELNELQYILYYHKISFKGAGSQS